MPPEKHSDKEILNLRPYFVNIASKRQKRILYLLLAIWAINLLLFLHWWFQPAHIITWPRYLLNTLLLLWLSFLPAYFFFFVVRMKRVNPSIPLNNSWRIAMVTTRAPSEPFEVVKETLEAMLRQKFPHDTWLADEDPDEEILAWCAAKGIKISCRKGITDYHRSDWPRRTRCKEGNLAYFYDTFGYDHYDIVVQMDPDHVPTDGYLEAMIRPFVNEEVGYVSAPSICDRNADNSWTARGRLFAEAIMHGPLQAGYNPSYSPLCIGSHYAVRTKALRAIGGLGPELAEDHSTTLMMQRGGWKGVHAIDAIAHGDGPPHLGACVVQEIQWSRSLMILLLTEMPHSWKRLSRGTKAQFLFSELWYPLFGSMLLIGTLLPVIAVLMGKPWVTVSYLEFLQHSLPVLFAMLAVFWYLRHMRLLRPNNVPLMSWETVLFQLFRWPWAVYGTIAGIISVIRGKVPGFRITPKGKYGYKALSWKILWPYVILILLSAIPGFITQADNPASGYLFFLIINALMYSILLLSMIIMNIYEQKN